MFVTLIFGGNQGDRKALIREAITEMSSIGKIQHCSSLYETAPWGFESSDSFYNQIVTYATDLLPEEVLDKCQATEQKLGRVRTGTQFCSRTMDIDILFCDSRVINTPRLTVPHPRLAQRNFVLAPLNESMPDFIHPVIHKNMTTLLSECTDTLKAEIIEKSFLNQSV